MMIELRVLEPWNEKETYYDNPRRFRAQLRRYLSNGASVNYVMYDVKRGMYVTAIWKHGADHVNRIPYTPGYQEVVSDYGSYTDMFFMREGYHVRWKILDLPNYTEDIAVINDALDRLERIMEQDSSSKVFAYGKPGLEGIRRYLDHNRE